MAESIPFRTGNILANEAATAIAAGTDLTALSATEMHAKNRRWEITAANAAANMPYNPYRRLLIIDATASTQDAYVVIAAGNDPATTVYAHHVEAGGYAEFTTALGEIGPEQMSVVSGGATASPIVVYERSAT